MPIMSMLDMLPLWGLFLITLLLVLISEESGFRLGSRRSRRGEDAKDAAAGSMVGATLGLLAFMLAFTFGLAAARYDTRRLLVRDEVNAVQTTFLRAAFIAEPRRTEVRNLLREYVQLRLAGVQDTAPLPAIARSEEIHRKLWELAVAEGEKNPGSIMVGLFVNTLNELIDIHTKRVQAGLRSRVPPVIIYTLYFVTVLAMTSVGYLAGLAGKRTHLVTGALVLAFSAVMLLIIDLDRPHEGLLKVNQQVLIDLQKKLAAPFH
jgi:hypothetical protein